MIVGNGQLAQVFEDCDNNDVCIFASGVSNSNCQDPKEFERERNLLLKTLEKNKDKKFVYYSSCALSAKEYPKNDYYKHKEYMENIIKEYSSNYYIFRIPQLFGNLILHKTLINFIYQSIKQEHRFNIYDKAYRYVIEVNDVKKLVLEYLKHSKSCITVDLANSYRYKVVDIVNIFEELLDKKAIYNFVEKDDQYTLDLSKVTAFIEDFDIDINFGEEYLKNKLKEKI